MLIDLEELAGEIANKVDGFQIETEPSGRSRYSTGTSAMRQRRSTAWIDSSVSIWKPSDSTGKVFTNGLDMARYPVMTSSKP